MVTGYPRYINSHVSGRFSMYDTQAPSLWLQQTPSIVVKPFTIYRVAFHCQHLHLICPIFSSSVNCGAL